MSNSSGSRDFIFLWVIQLDFCSETADLDFELGEFVVGIAEIEVGDGVALYDLVEVEFDIEQVVL